MNTLTVLTYPLNRSADISLVRYDVWDAWLPPGARILEIIDVGAYMQQIAALVDTDTLTGTPEVRHFVVAVEIGPIHVVAPDVHLVYIGMVDSDQTVRRYLFEIVADTVPDPDGWGPCTNCGAAYDGPGGYCHGCGGLRIRRRDTVP